MEISIQREISTLLEISETIENSMILFYATCPHIIKNQILAGNLFYATCPHIIKNQILAGNLFYATWSHFIKNQILEFMPYGRISTKNIFWPK